MSLRAGVAFFGLWIVLLVAVGAVLTAAAR
jgi:hypothetical protein